MPWGVFLTFLAQAVIVLRDAGQPPAQGVGG